MSLLDRLETKFPRLGIPGLLRTVSMLMVLTYGLDMMKVVPLHFWMLQGNAVLSGEVWRLLTFLFVPASSHPIFLMFELMILVMLGDGLESAWGSFRMTAYYVTGAVATLLIAIILPSEIIGSGFLNLSLFLAFATLFPDFEILVFFVIPVKMKYLAIFSALGIVWSVLFGSFAMKITALFTIGVYLLFFGFSAITAITRGASNYQRRQKMEAAYARDGKARHSCTICGRTEMTDPNLEFRYCTCSQCGDNGQAFCLEHLSVHKGTQVSR